MSTKTKKYTVEQKKLIEEYYRVQEVEIVAMNSLSNIIQEKHKLKIKILDQELSPDDVLGYISKEETKRLNDMMPKFNKSRSIVLNNYI